MLFKNKYLYLLTSPLNVTSSSSTYEVLYLTKQIDYLIAMAKKVEFLRFIKRPHLSFYLNLCLRP